MLHKSKWDTIPSLASPLGDCDLPLTISHARPLAASRQRAELDRLTAQAGTLLRATAISSAQAGQGVGSRERQRRAATSCAFATARGGVSRILRCR